MSAEERKAAEDRYIRSMSWKTFWEWIMAGRPPIVFGHVEVDVDRWVDEEQGRQAEAKDAYWRSKELRDSGDIRPESTRGLV